MRNGKDTTMIYKGAITDSECSGLIIHKNFRSVSSKVSVFYIFSTFVWYQLNKNSGTIQLHFGLSVDLITVLKFCGVLLFIKVI